MKHIIFIILFSFAAIVFATQAPPQPFCEVTGVVEKSGGLTVDVRITKVLGTAEIGMDSTPSCTELYSQKTIENVDLVYGTPLEKGQHFSGVITWMGDEFESGYSMAEVELIAAPSKSDEVIDSGNPLFWTRLALLVLILLIALAFGLYIILKRHAE
jgi:hypothetical protein